MIANIQEQCCKYAQIGNFANEPVMDGLENDTRFVKDLCTWSKLTPSALASRAGLAATTMTRHFRGTATTRISQPTFDKLKRAFPDFPGFRQEYSDHVGMHGDQSDPNLRPGELAYVREVDISYAMGDGAEIEDYPAVDLVPFNTAFLRAISNANTDALFLAKGHGESMEPTLLRSDAVMIDTSQNRVAHQDQIWALVYAGAGMIKRLRRINTDDGPQFVILSDNPLVPPQPAKMEDVHIIGKVIWAARRLQ